MKKTVDARGLACPQPVVLAGKAMADAERVTVLVDDEVAVENVTRLGRARGFSVERSDRPDGIVLDLAREGAAAEPAAGDPPVACGAGAGAAGRTVVLVTSDALGTGPIDLGERLIGMFFHVLIEIDPGPGAIVFVNTGVRLVTEGSGMLDDLKALEANGIDVMACGTCLGYFGFTEKVRVGRVSNMLEIATVLLQAGKVVGL